MNYNCYVLVDIIIPIACALIGGGLTLIGVIITIRHENKKAKNEYTERIRPYFVVEQCYLPNAIPKDVSTIYFADDSTNDPIDGDIIYHWNSLLLTNVSENVCLIDYVRIGKTKYNIYDRVPIKASQSIVLKGYPLSTYICAKGIESVAIGVQDRQQNNYEYDVLFEISDAVPKENRIKKKENKAIVFESIDCSNYKLNGKTIANNKRKPK